MNKISVILNTLYFTGRGAGHTIPQSMMSCFPGFLPAIEACALNWKNIDLGIALEEIDPQVSPPLTLPCARIYSPCLDKDPESEQQQSNTNVMELVTGKE